MTCTAEPPPMTRRFSSRKLARVLAHLGWTPTRLAAEVGVREQSVKNWLEGKKPALEGWLDLVDVLRRHGVEEAELLDVTK